MDHLNRMALFISAFVLFSSILWRFSFSAVTPVLDLLSSTDCAECSMTPEEIIQYNGYVAEKHYVKTEDSFELSLIRIPPQDRETGLRVHEKRPVVLLVHALLDCAIAWIANFPHQSLAYILADAGYDVWIMNERGNVYSMPTCNEISCWDFSFDEIALYDIPATLKYITSNAGVESVSYIGHSQGTTSLFAALSTYNATQSVVHDKINCFIALAPVAFLGHHNSLFFSLFSGMRATEILGFFGQKQFLASSKALRGLAEMFCSGGITTTFCKELMFSIIGRNPTSGGNLNESRLIVYLTHTPAGTSIQNMNHWSQLARSGRFQKYDYGYKYKNHAKYGVETPPEYDLATVTIPTALFTGGRDLLSNPLDVLELKRRIDTKYVFFEKNIDNYDHLDFVIGVNARAEVYNDILDILSERSTIAQTE